MIKVKALKTCPVALDGIGQNILHIKEGDVYEIHVEHLKNFSDKHRNVLFEEVVGNSVEAKSVKQKEDKVVKGKEDKAVKDKKNK